MATAGAAGCWLTAAHLKVAMARGQAAAAAVAAGDEVREEDGGETRWMLQACSSSGSDGQRVESRESVAGGYTPFLVQLTQLLHNSLARDLDPDGRERERS